MQVRGSTPYPPPQSSASVSPGVGDGDEMVKHLDGDTENGDEMVKNKKIKDLCDPQIHFVLGAI